MVYVFIDPGKHTGWAIFDVNGNIISNFTTHTFEDTVNHLSDLVRLKTIKKLIYENFALFPWKSQDQMWSEFETVQVIGAIRYACIRHLIDYEKVPPRNKDMGFMYMGTKEPSHSNPLNHQLVAHAHGVFWLQRAGIRQPQAR